MSDLRVAAPLGANGNIESAQAADAFANWLRAERRNRFVQWLCWPAMIGANGYVVLQSPSLDLATLVIVGCTASVVVFAVSASAKTVRGIAARARACMTAANAGVLTDCLRFPASRVRREARDALKRILPAIDERHRGQFGASRIEKLLRELSGKDRELTIAILQGLGEIGDEPALPHVERLVDSPDSCVREAAAAALPRIQARVAKLREARTLLRAADAPTGESNVLLRPAGAAESEESRLLRPADGL